MVTFTGVECHNEWEITFEEIHRNGAIAYAIYNYTNYTGDTEYLKNEGLEVLAEIARFWADRVHFSKRANKYMIHGVTYQTNMRTISITIGIQIRSQLGSCVTREKII